MIDRTLQFLQQGIPAGKRAWATLLLLAATAAVSSAQKFKTLASFEGESGDQPYYETLTQGADGNLYGTTIFGGGGSGNVFRLTPTGSLNSINDFPGLAPYPGGPETGLVLGSDGNLYGVADGGAYDMGVVYKVNYGGVVTPIYSFCAATNSNGYCADGYLPIGQLILGTDGDFYGTTHFGGDNNDGTIFKLTPKGVLTTLYSFCAQANCADGANPNSGLVQATDGNFYGTTYFGGPGGFSGTVYKITPKGVFTLLYGFCSESFCTDGQKPNAPLIQAGNGDFYGTASQGGANSSGTVFKITPAGKLTTLYSFCVLKLCADGEGPMGALVQATDGNFYGTTSEGGPGFVGTVFKLTLGGKLTVLHGFSGPDGNSPFGGLLQATNGTFYGTTNIGGDSSFGVTFSESVGLGPFVKTVPVAARAGANVIILGTNLTGASSVTFNGVDATITEVKRSEIKVTVPTGATTGTVQVITPGGTLSSNVAFRVLP